MHHISEDEVNTNTCPEAQDSQEAKQQLRVDNLRNYALADPRIIEYQTLYQPHRLSRKSRVLVQVKSCEASCSGEQALSRAPGAIHFRSDI